MVVRRVVLALAMCLSLITPSVSAASGVDILGTHYSERLAQLLGRVEKTIGSKVVFVPKPTPDGDNSGEFVNGTYQITLKRGSSEDDVAHELTHPLLETAGYANAFFIPTNPLSRTIHSFIASDFDHLFINQWLHREGYYPEKGFMLGMKDQYKAFATDSALANTLKQGNSTQRALVGVAVIHQLMKQVYYVRSSQAENAILATYPRYRNHWHMIRQAIDVFLREPTPSHEWYMVGVTAVRLKQGGPTASVGPLMS
jgi:hypothetical protein